MESVHGIDVSWIHNTHNKDHHRHAKPQSTAAENSSPPENGSKSPQISAKPVHNGEALTPKEAPATAPAPTTATPLVQSPQRPSFPRATSAEKPLTPGAKTGPPSHSPSRRNSWLSNLSAKFSASPTNPPQHQNGSNPSAKPAAQEDPTFRQTQWNTPKNSPSKVVTPKVISPKVAVAKQAVLAHGTRPEGIEPYTPAPVKSGQSNFLQSAFRRLSSSGGQLSGPGKLPHYGLCERKVLNVDSHRERPRFPELDQSKLRRVSFCVDVEIAGGPKYTNEEGEKQKEEKKEKKKLVEKGEGEALKNPMAVKEEKEQDGVVKATGEEMPKEPEVEGEGAILEETEEEPTEKDSTEKDTTKKKEKKKRSEEERKARKEKKRKLAEANGTVPVELLMDGSDSSLESPPSTVPGTPKTQVSPTTDPVRIYRRCCQLRETPILKKITEQLSSPTNCGIEIPGLVSKLDLSGYWLQLPDLITLGDYLAVVPIKELIMENCGLTDEGVRVILAGLLAAKNEGLAARRKQKIEKYGYVAHQGGVVERVVFKNNSKIGRDGWGHIALFIHMSHSLKCMDLSMIPFPQPAAQSSTATPTKQMETHEIFARALGERLAGPEFELLNMAETGLTTEQLGFLADAVNKSGLRRLGLAGNQITVEGMEHVCRYLKQGKCEGLDLGGIDLKDHLGMLAGSLNENHPLWALSLANCGLTPESLWQLFPALSKLKGFRFIDLSHNHELFSTNPSALSLFRRYLPKMRILKRIHLCDVAMTAEQAIALAEILPESPSLAHVNILENSELSLLANALDESQQEEACAFYASLMAAVRVSKTLMCIDIDVPSPESSEIVKALAKQVIAYSLRNMERGPVAEITEAAATTTEANEEEREVAVPDVLIHLVGHVEDFHENHDDDEPAPDDDYVIGGTGVVKALGICLRNKINDSRRQSSDRLNLDSDTSGANTPKSVSGGKAKDMSKNLLGSARKIRARLQPALIKEARTGDRNAYNRLLFLDHTLEGMIKRFEDEYPETRLPTTFVSSTFNGAAEPLPSDIVPPSIDDATTATATDSTTTDLPPDDDEDTPPSPTHPGLSRPPSDVSLASKALSLEEGRMLRFGQKFRRGILKPDPSQTGGDPISEHEVLAPHLELLRCMTEGLGGEEIRRKVEEEGEEAVLKELSQEASVWRQKLMESDPEAWERFRQSQEAAMRNVVPPGDVEDVVGEVVNGGDRKVVIDTTSSAIVD